MMTHATRNSGPRAPKQMPIEDNFNDGNCKGWTVCTLALEVNTDCAPSKTSAATDTHFSLDNIRIASDDLSSTATYAYDDANEMTSMAEGKTGIAGSTTTFTYDGCWASQQLMRCRRRAATHDWGRTITRSMASPAHQAVYQYRYGDKVKRIDSTWPDENALAQYIYDGFGKRRLAVVDSTEWTWWRWDLGWNMIAEYDDPDTDWDFENQSRTYIPGLAEIMGADASTGTYRYYLTDNLGSVRRIRDDGMASLANYEFTPYGGMYHGSGLALNIGYTGHMWDPAANMYFAPFRYYTPGHARWLTRDPLGYVDGPNLYGYVGQNPVIFVDPMGLRFCFVDFFGGHRGDWVDQGLAIGADLGASVAVVAGTLAITLSTFGVGGVAVAAESEGVVGSLLTGFTRHGLNQIISRGGVGVANSALLNALRNPQSIEYDRIRDTINYVGTEATVVLNQAGQLVTAWGQPRCP